MVGLDNPIGFTVYLELRKLRGLPRAWRTIKQGCCICLKGSKTAHTRTMERQSNDNLKTQL